jgi:thymidylate synthase (FAD)
VKGLIRRDHLAMVEFTDATVRFVTNRGVTHELVRHRLCSFAQESTRYVNYTKNEMEFIKPIWWDKWTLDQQFIWETTNSDCEASYNRLIEEGATPQEARDVLPNSVKTEIIVRTNFREWMHIFKLRCSKAAHPQIRELMNKCLLDFYTRAPVIFEDLYLNREIVK